MRIRITREDVARGQRYLYDFGDQLGDWLALDGRTKQSMQGGTDEGFIGSCYYANSVRLTARAAKALGKVEDEKKYLAQFEKIRAAILREYFSPAGRLCVDTQTGYVVSLYTGVYADKQRVVDGLKKRIYRDCGRLTGGFVGAPIMCRALAENGMEAEAFRFLLSEAYPGWLNCVKLGATTVWERWNSVLQDGRISGTHMNSLNHYAYGAVAAYLYRDVAGLRAVEPGLKRVQIAPQVNARLRYLRLRYESIHGAYEIEWEIRSDGLLRVAVAIPFDCTAELTLPHDPDGAVRELHSGRYEYLYRPAREVRSIYDRLTQFHELLDDARAVAAIRRHCPQLLFFLESGD